MKFYDITGTHFFRMCMAGLCALLFAGCVQNPPCDDTKNMGGAHGDTKQPTGNTECGFCDCSFEVVQEFPHDGTAFTQGLLFADGVFYEGTGLYGQSSLRIVTIDTGVPRLTVPLDASLFGEGIALVNNEIIQLTWKAETALRYEKSTLTGTGQFEYAGEGWGLCYDGVSLIMSDGSDQISFRNPQTFAVERSITVTDLNGAVSRLNELEYINGQIFANVWMSDRIVRIDPLTGEVVGNIDLKGLLPDEERIPGTDVLNGIAYDAVNDRLFVTGKRWPKVYEIKLVPKT